MAASLKRVLIANRGEIACRIAATLREMGIVPIAVYSDADRGARHVREAADAVAIGPAEARGSYLNGPALIEAARRTGAQAVHPGYGFLAENADFAEAVENAGLTFIGPTPEQIRAMGDKRAARGLAEAAGVPVVPGATGNDTAALARAGSKIGYPVMIKAALGGGGKGMSVAHDEAELQEAVDAARRLAASAFGDDAVYLEKLVPRPRHVEVQVLGDGAGRVVHLLERECSLQRRHQKVIEECPSPAVDTALRERMTSAAVTLARAVRYRGAGTVEFLLGADGAFYFLEMNTRLQVEHPVTELVTGVDLVRAQIEIAAEHRLPDWADSITARGHAIEARVYAEDAARGFLPQAGTAAKVRWPRGAFVRVDAGIDAGDVVSVHYDPILAKVVAHGSTREDARARLSAALDDALVHGVTTNLPFLRALIRSSEVARGAFDTEWIEREFMDSFEALASAPAPELALIAASLHVALGGGAAIGLGANGRATSDAMPETTDPFCAAGAWRLA